ncbi:MAG: hypothetical protein R3B47_00070 [Bacteroidia bacterium]
MLWPAATVGSLLLAYYSIGYNMLPDKGALSSGFGQFSANLNTFFNSMDRMELIPGMPLPFRTINMRALAIWVQVWIVLLIAAFFLLVEQALFISKTKTHALPVLELR